MRNTLAALLLLLSSASGLLGQQLTATTIVTFTSSGGRQLSAVPAQSLGASPNSGGWEQWQLDPVYSVLHSFHGTILTITFDGGGKAFHAPYKANDGLVVDGYSDGRPGMPIVNGGKVLIYSRQREGWLWAIEDVGGTIVTREIDKQYRAIPAEAFWTINIVTNPAGGRQELRKTLTDGLFDIRSAHGTYLNVNYATGAVTLQTARPLSAIGVQNEYTAKFEPAAIRFGEDIFIREVNPESGWWTVQPSGKIDNGLETVAFITMKDWGPGGQWTIMPTGYYKNGDRVPVGIPVFLRSAKGTFLSADPRLPAVRLTGSTGEWEHWTFNLR